MTTIKTKPIGNGMNFVKTKDEKGNMYHKIFYSDNINICIAIGEKNYIIPMQLNISMREGRSSFGDEIVVQLVKNGNISTHYQKASPKDHVEFYLPKEKGLMLFRECLSNFEFPDFSDSDIEVKESSNDLSKWMD